MKRLAQALLLAALASGCATARLVGERPVAAPDLGLQRTVVVEPLFEQADWITSTKTEYATVMSPSSGFGPSSYGGLYGPSNVAITRQVTEKPLFARVQVLEEIHRRVIPAVQRLRPSWRVTSTSGAPVLTGDLTVVRTVIEGNEVVASNRPIKTGTFVLGLVLWPLQIYTAMPVEETTLVHGLLERFDTSAALLNSRLVRYPTQADYAVNLSGVSPLRHEFGLELNYEEGYLADENPRTPVLIDGFVDKLAVAIVAIVEERAQPPAQSPAPKP